MNIFKTRQEKYGLITNNNLSWVRLNGDNISGFVAKDNREKLEKININEIECMYDVGNIIDTYLNNPKLLKELFRILKKEWSKNPTWDGNHWNYEERKKEKEKKEIIEEKTKELEIIKKELEDLLK